MSRWPVAILLLTATCMRYLGAPTELKSPEIRVEGVALEDDLAQVERTHPDRFRHGPIHTGGLFRFFEVELQSRDRFVTYVRGYRLRIDTRRFDMGHSTISELEAALGPALISTDCYGEHVYHWPGYKLRVSTFQDGHCLDFGLGVHRESSRSTFLDPPRSWIFDLRHQGRT